MAVKPRERLTEAQRLALVDQALADAPESFRLKVLRRVVDADLAEARKAHRRASEAEAYKRDLIVQNAQDYKTATEQTVDALEAAAGLLRMTVLAVEAVVHAERRGVVLVAVREQLLRVAGPWRDCWPGAEAGRGIPAYDSTEGVERVRREVERLRRRNPEEV